MGHYPSTLASRYQPGHVDAVVASFFYIVCTSFAANFPDFWMKQQPAKLVIGYPPTWPQPEEYFVETCWNQQPAVKQRCGDTRIAVSAWHHAAPILGWTPYQINSLVAVNLEVAGKIQTVGSTVAQLLNSCHSNLRRPTCLWRLGIQGNKGFTVPSPDDCFLLGKNLLMASSGSIHRYSND